MAQISRLARAAVRARLADASAGFNALAAPLCAEYGISPIEIDFSPGSRQVYEGALSIADIEGTTSPRRGTSRAVAALYSTGATNTGVTVDRLFSGSVNVVLQIALDYVGANAQIDYETRADVVEEALFASLHDRAWATPAPCVYGGDMAIVRGPVLPDGSNWRQIFTARMTFTVITQE